MEKLENARGDEQPFREQLESLDYTSGNQDLRTLPSAKEKVIRHLPDTYFEHFKGYAAEQDVDPVAVATKANRLFRELKMQYDIPLVADFVVGKNKGGRSAVYVVADRIEGKTLDHLFLRTIDDKDRDNAIQELKHLCISLTQYIKDKYDQKESFLWDIFKSWQYMYGKAPGEEGSHIYLVDVDPLYGNTSIEFLNAVDHLLGFIGVQEESSSGQFNLKDTKNMLKDLRVRIIDDKEL